MQTILDDLRWIHEHGIWEALTFLIAAGGLFVGVKLAFFPRRRIRNLNFYTRLVRNGHPQFPLIVYLELRNYTGRSVVLSSPFIRFRDVRLSTDAHGDSPSGEYEVKFPDPRDQQLSEVECLLRNKENVQTIIPLDPAHSDIEVQAALNQKRLGILTITCTWLRDTPYVEKLVRKL